MAAALFDTCGDDLAVFIEGDKHVDIALQVAGNRLCRVELPGGFKFAHVLLDRLLPVLGGLGSRFFCWFGRLRWACLGFCGLWFRGVEMEFRRCRGWCGTQLGDQGGRFYGRRRVDRKNQAGKQR